MTPKEENDLSERIAKLCLDKFSSLPKQGKPVSGKWTVLSGVVLETSSSLSVISLATGTKCLSGCVRLGHPAGALVHDSHAEVLARRGAIRWIMELISRGNDHRIFVRDENGGLEVRDDVNFHMFTSHPPCGDASIFPIENVEDHTDSIGKLVSVSESEDDNDEPAKKKLKIDVNRTGAKCVENGQQDKKGEGVEYHTVGEIRTKPGRGDRTLSLSCSDKLLKWNLVGFQGALCSVLIKNPIYMKTLVVASDYFDKECLERALFGRYGKGDINIIKVVQSKLRFSFEKKLGTVACPDSVLWWEAMEGKAESYVEGLKQGWSRKKMDNPKSWAAVSQRKMAELALPLVQNCGKSGTENVDSYLAMKEMAKDYNIKWTDCKKRLKNWPNKHLRDFSL